MACTACVSGTARRPVADGARGRVALGRAAGCGLDPVALARRPGSVVLAGHLLSSRCRSRRHVVRIAAGRGSARPHCRGRVVAPGREANVAGHGGGRLSDARGALRCAVLRPRDRAPSERGEHRAVAIMAGGAGRHRNGTHSVGGGVGPGRQGAGTRFTHAARGVRLGRGGGDRWTVAVEPARRVARVVHLPLAPCAGRRDCPGPAAVGPRRHGRGRRNGGRPPRLGRGGRRTLVPREP